MTAAALEHLTGGTLVALCLAIVAAFGVCYVAWHLRGKP